MKKKNIIIISIIILIAGYLYFSYAHIYNKIGSMALASPQKQKIYTVSNKNTKQIRYVAFGDSLTAGVGVATYEQSYPYLLAQKISSKEQKTVELIPIATPGVRTQDVSGDSLDQVIKLKPDIVTILFGVNDIHGGVSRDNFYKNYSHIINRITKETDAVVYVINIPYIGYSSLILPPHNYYFDSKTKEFNETLKQIKEEYPVRYIDLYTQTQTEIDKKTYYASDLFHPGEEGYALWAKIIYDAFNK
jgi:acyl-CoA thioesterase-1